MKKTTITCNICQKPMGVLPDEDEQVYFADGIIHHSNYPSYVHLEINTHGKFGMRYKEMDICEDCYEELTLLEYSMMNKRSEKLEEK